MREVSDKFNVSKSTVYHCRNRVCSILAQASNRFITWPTTDEDKQQTEADFAKIAKFPGALQLHKYAVMYSSKFR